MSKKYIDTNAAYLLGLTTALNRELRNSQLSGAPIHDDTLNCFIQEIHETAHKIVLKEEEQ